jgi:alkylation response protein AidB-like acyl-CoA dehydrogenase
MHWHRFELDEATAATIESLRPVLTETERGAEDERKLPRDALDALLDAGLFKIALPREVGGLEAEPLFECEVYEAVARISPTACWNLFIGNLHTAIPTVYAGDEGFEAMWRDGSSPLVAGQYAPVGVGTKVDGGIRVSGRYSWGSGIDHANWVLGACMVDGAGLGFVVPAEEVKVLDNWYVAGLAGTSSTDYELIDVFVPDGFWFGWMEPVQQRGGTRYSTHIRSQIAACHTGFALGAGERAFDEITRLAGTKTRMKETSTVADRGAFQRDVGRSYAQLAAARAYAADMLTELTRYQHIGGGLPDGYLERVHAMVTYATEVALDVALMAFRYGGGTALRLESPIQRTLRDLLAAQQHMYVADHNYDALGRYLSGRMS